MTDNVEITRRRVVAGVATTPFASMSLAGVLADPKLVRAAAGTLESITLETDGGLTVSAALALPDRTPAASVLLIHEWWGLNDQIKAVAAELAREGYFALAIDLYGGAVTDDRQEASTLMGQVDPLAALDTIGSWLRWLKAEERVNGKIGTIGWCFGGGWSLTGSTVEPVDATVVYYGRVTVAPESLETLQGPVLGHFATEDKFINADMVSGFEANMDTIGHPYTTHWYEANHAFANPTSARYDSDDAATAWRRTLEFFETHLKRA